MALVFDVFVALVGLAVGSFLNVCIYRLPRGESLLRPPSRCPGCERPIRWAENLPVVSYLMLRGRCPGCGARISPMYPIVEIVTAALFVTTVAFHGAGLLVVSRLIFLSAMIVLFVIDLQHRILPNVITLPGIVAGLIFSLITGVPPWKESLIGILAGGGVLFGVAEVYYRLRNEEGLGMGDVKMLGMIGAFLGWRLMLVTLVISSFLGSVIGLGMIVWGRGGLKYALPFGTFLAIGALVASVFGEPILAWYLDFY